MRNAELDAGNAELLARLCVTTIAVLHIIRSSRGADVVRSLFGDIRPRVWISESLGSQRGDAGFRHMCLAHLLRDTPSTAATRTSRWR